MARHCCTICLPIDQKFYSRVVDDPALFRDWLNRNFQDNPELFPKHFAHGYTLKDDRLSAKTGLRLRRVQLNATGGAFSVRPSFVLPYMIALADDVGDALLVRSFGVPFWILARVFGRGHDYWYRLVRSLGRNSVTGTTLRKVDPPEHLLADEHHTRREGKKSYVATTVGGGCCLGVGLALSAGEADLTGAYGVFREEVREVKPDYSPKTVNADGWASTHAAWVALFPLVVVIRCFLHGWLAIRSRGKLKENFRELSTKIWDAYHAPDRRTFSQRMRRLGDWTRKNVKATWVLEKVGKLCSRVREYGIAYRHPGCHRTSNALDRVMRSLNRYLVDGQHLHGSPDSGELHVRAWALLYNFRPWHPLVAKKNGGWRSPAERLNRHRYHDDWLQNLLVSASMGGHRL